MRCRQPTGSGVGGCIQRGMGCVVGAVAQLRCWGPRLRSGPSLLHGFPEVDRRVITVSRPPDAGAWLACVSAERLTDGGLDPQIHPLRGGRAVEASRS
jgi:hypothetical protein